MRFQNSPPERQACFYLTITGSFECYQYFDFETNFLKNENLFQKMEYLFQLKVLRLKAQYFHAKLPAMLRQIEWKVQNRPITKNGVLPVTIFFC